MLTGLRDRLERELTNTAPHTAKVKVTSPSNALERRFSTWIGETQGWSSQYYSESACGCCIIPSISGIGVYAVCESVRSLERAFSGVAFLYMRVYWHPCAC